MDVRTENYNRLSPGSLLYVLRLMFALLLGLCIRGPAPPEYRQKTALVLLAVCVVEVHRRRSEMSAGRGMKRIFSNVFLPIHCDYGLIRYEDLESDILCDFFRSRI